MTAPLAFLDCETDGVHPGRKPWEIAIVRREPDGTEIEWQAFVEIDLATADPFGLRVGRFYDRHPFGQHISQGKELPEFRALRYLSRWDAAHAVARLTHGAHIVGAVPNFDTECLDPLLREHGLLPGWHYHLIDVESLAVGHLAAQGKAIVPPWRSDELGELLGVESASDEERHTAMGDVRWVMRTYDAIMNSSQ
jgi:hypothetical protein